MNLLDRIIQALISYLRPIADGPEQDPWVRKLIYRFIFYISLSYVQLYFWKVSLLSYIFANYCYVMLFLAFSLFLLMLIIVYHFLLEPEDYFPAREPGPLPWNATTFWRVFCVVFLVFLYLVMIGFLFWYLFFPEQVDFFYFCLGNEPMRFMEMLGIITLVLTGISAATAVESF